jgi:hypothetical protein
MPLAQAQPTSSRSSSPTFYDARKLDAVQKAWLWQLLQDDPSCPSRVVLQKAAGRHQVISISTRHLNRLRRKWGVNRPRGRPCQADSRLPVPSGSNVVQVNPQMSFVGVHLFAHWLDQQNAFAALVDRLREQTHAYQVANPQADFALLHHRDETLVRRLMALVLAPLLGIGRLSELDRHDHPLESLVGTGYHSSTLTQFVGQLERIDAARALVPMLCQASWGTVGYVDGHMIAYWSRVSMHKGKITMLGRIMAGSQAVVAHDQQGQAVFAEYHPPDTHLSHVIVPYCETVSQLTELRVFVIDREVNSVAMARAFEQSDLGLLSMLDSNEHHGLASFETTPLKSLADGSRVYEAQWKEVRDDDPRRFVLVESPDSEVLVYWGTSKVADHVEVGRWPEVYHQRSELQENSFKRMNAHGALKINYGRKKKWGVDRHHERQQAEVRRRLDKATQQVHKHQGSVEGQHEKVQQSEQRGHGKLLAKRQAKLIKIEADLRSAQSKEKKLQEQNEALSSPRQRADRDFRKQTLMTFRTLLLENFLMRFMALLLGGLSQPLSMDSILTLLFHRHGSCMETANEVVYWLSPCGLSVSTRRSLEEMVAVLNGMDLKCRGKAIRVRLRSRSP